MCFADAFLLRWCWTLLSKSPTLCLSVCLSFTTASYCLNRAQCDCNDNNPKNNGRGLGRWWETTKSMCAFIWTWLDVWVASWIRADIYLASGGSSVLWANRVCLIGQRNVPKCLLQSYRKERLLFRTRTSGHLLNHMIGMICSNAKEASLQTANGWKRWKRDCFCKYLCWKELSQMTSPSCTSYDLLQQTSLAKWIFWAIFCDDVASESELCPSRRLGFRADNLRQNVSISIALASAISAFALIATWESQIHKH